tara:strand:- start:1616 stop:2320 length:705 start_codon:yes stop_codon:yes gene_type:complete
MVSIDNVYKTVLNILNKENRGYIVPREFNTLANQAQSEIFEGYFSLRNYVISNDSDYSNIRKNIEEKIALFENEETISPGTFANAAGNTTTNYFAYPTNFYRLGTVSVNAIHASEVSSQKILYLNRSPLTKPGQYCPVYVRHEGGIVIYPTTGYANVDITYIRKPAEPQWKGGTLSGQIVKNESDGAYQNFELHSSEFPELVIRILTYAGVSIRAADITQAATVKEQQIIQSEQ